MEIYESCLARQAQIETLFSECQTEEAKYQKIIFLGRELPQFDEALKTPDRIVHGCQSTVYLNAYLHEGKVIFQVASDALISSGLAALLIHVYSGETPETILKCPPSYLEKLGIHASLTPSRSNGLYSIHLRMKQEALRLLVERH